MFVIHDQPNNFLGDLLDTTFAIPYLYNYKLYRLPDGNVFRHGFAQSTTWHDE
jgi:hypothetical protein